MVSTRLAGKAAAASLGLSQPLLPTVPSEVSVHIEGDDLSDVDSNEKNSGGSVFVTVAVYVLAGSGCKFIYVSFSGSQD